MTPEKRPAEDEGENGLSKKTKAEEEENNGINKLDKDGIQEDAIEESEKKAVLTVATTSDIEQKDNLSRANLTTVKSSDSSQQRLKLPSENGTVVFCGCVQWDYIGRRNLKCIPSMMHFTPRLLKPLAGIKVSYVAAHCSSAHGVLITSEGKAMTFGRNEKGQLGVGDAEAHAQFNLVEALKDDVIVQAAVGRNHTLFLNDRGSVFSCGDNKSGQCGLGSTAAVITTPTKIDFKDSIINKVACGADYSMIVNNKGHLYSFGLPEYGQLGHNTDGKYFVTCNKLTFQFETKPKRVPVFVERAKDGHPTPVTDVHIIDISCGNNHSVAVDSRKRAFSWGFGGYGRLGHAEQKDEMVPRFIKFFEGPKRGVLKAFCGGSYTIALTELGVYLWGQTKRTGEANMYPKPLQDLFGWGVREIGCSATSIVVAADNSVIAWGPSPTYGELGLGDNTKSSTTPKEVKALDGAFVQKVACSSAFTVMIVKDETEEDKNVLSKLKEIDL